MYKLITRDNNAKRGEFHTVHGVIQTPVFMNVGTIAAIKGAVSTMDLQEIKTQVQLSNTYHLHVRPGDEVVRDLGGIRKFMSLLERWVAFISLWYGTSRYLRIRVDFRFFRWQDFVRLKKKAYILILT